MFQTTSYATKLSRCLCLTFFVRRGGLFPVELFLKECNVWSEIYSYLNTTYVDWDKLRGKTFFHSFLFFNRDARRDANLTLEQRNHFHSLGCSYESLVSSEQNVSNLIFLCLFCWPLWTFSLLCILVWRYLLAKPLKKIQGIFCVFFFVAMTLNLCFYIFSFPCNIITINV